MEQTTTPNAPAKSPAKVHHAVAACAAEEDELSAARSGAAVAHGVTRNESTMIEAPRARGARMSVRATLHRRSAEQETASTGTAVPCEAYRRMCFNESEPTCMGGRSAFGRAARRSAKRRTQVALSSARKCADGGVSGHDAGGVRSAHAKRCADAVAERTGCANGLIRRRGRSGVRAVRTSSSTSAPT